MKMNMLQSMFASKQNKEVTKAVRMSLSLARDIKTIQDEWAVLENRAVTESEVIRNLLYLAIVHYRKG